MNGPEHYAKAEDLLRSSESAIRHEVQCRSAVYRERAANLAAAAQVHATLALVVYLREIGDQLDTRLRVRIDPEQLAKIVAVGSKRGAR
jgi:hypothetical protein